MPKGPKGEKRPADVISKNTTNANGQSPATRFRFTLNGDHASLIISGRPWFDGARNLLYAPRSALVIDHPNSRFLQLRRLILMATSSARSAATLNDPHAAEAARREAVTWSLRLSAFADEIWAAPVRRWQDVLERAELTLFHRPATGTPYSRFDQATDELVSSVFVMGGRHG